MSTLSARGRSFAAQLTPRLRRQLERVRVVLGEGPRVSGLPVSLVRHAGRWTWVHEHPRAARSDLRVQHLARLHDILSAAGVPAFLVADPGEQQHQLGVVEEHWSAAVTAIVAGLRGEGWYAVSRRQRWLVDRLPTGHDDAMVLYPCYRPAHDQAVIGRELGVLLVPWRREEQVYVPARRNPQAAALRPVDLEVVEVERHARRWPVPRALATPHADEVGPLPWVVHVPARLRREAPEAADLLGRAAARSVWFHGPPGVSLTVLDSVQPAWCCGPDAPEVRLHDEDVDETAALARLWARADGALAVLPVGGLLLRDVTPQSLVSPGGIGRFDIDADWIDDVPDGLRTRSLTEAHGIAAWFERRTGARMRWRLSRAPYALPALGEESRRDLEDFLDDADRPRTDDAATAALPAMWWAHGQGLALPGSLTVAHLTPGAAHYRRALSRLGAGEGRAVVASVDLDHLLDAPTERQHLADLVGRRLPLAAPWEPDVPRRVSGQQE